MARYGSFGLGIIAHPRPVKPDQPPMARGLYFPCSVVRRGYFGQPFIMEKPGTTPPFAARMNRLGTETAFDVLARVVALRAQGKDIISFGIGEPDFDTPRNIKEAAERAIDEGKTKYVPSAGIAELRQQIAQYVAKTRSIPVASEEVVVTPGAKPMLFNSIMACLNEGDEG